MTAADLHPDTREVRPSSCCGVCPPIAGGGWDCTCPGLPGCPAALADAGLGKSAEAAALAAERDALAARLAAVEALADEWENNEAYACRDASDCTRCVTYQGAVIRLRAVLSAAPTDTTKETP